MSRTTREPCGCRSTDSRWTELCPTHRAEYEELHTRAAIEYRTAQAEFHERTVLASA